jgi:hypothetical protein
MKCKGRRLFGRLLMSKPILSAVLFVGAIAITGSAFAAELMLPAGAHVRREHLAPACGPCGCLHVSYVFHRDIRATYGTGFDPRNFDQTEPHFYPGPVRGYPRYWVSVDPEQ